MKFCRLVFVPLLFCLSALAQKTSDVVVTNTSNNPVPTVATGTTAVSGAVAITGTPTVTLGTGSIVAIDPSTTVNTSATSARNIIRLLGGSFLPDGSLVAQSSLAGTPTAFLVPGGKRMVINFASIQIIGPTGFTPAVTVSFSESLPNGDLVVTPVPIPLQKQPSSGNDVYLATFPGPVYVDQNRSLVLNVGSATSWNAFAEGYLLDCGAGCTQP